MADEPIARMLVTLRFILLAIVLGLLTFAVVSVVLVTRGMFAVQPHLAPTLLPMLGLVAAIAIVAYLVIRRVMSAGPTHTDAGLTPERLIGRFTGLTIAGGALAEGPGLFGVVVFLLTGQWPALLVPLLCLGAVILLIPSRDRFTRFAERCGVHDPQA